MLFKAVGDPAPETPEERERRLVQKFLASFKEMTSLLKEIEQLGIYEKMESEKK